MFIKTFFVFIFMFVVAHEGQGQGVKIHLNELESTDSDSLKIASYQRLVKFYHYSHSDSALYFQQQVLSKSMEHNLPEDEARALVNIASVLQLKDPSGSLNMLEKALAITGRIRELSLMSEIYEAMTDLHKKQNNFKEALLLTEKRQLLKDSLFSIQKSKEIANVQAINDLARQEGEMKDLAVLNEKSIVQRNVSITVALISFGFILIVWYFNNKISKLNRRLLEKQRELKNSNTIKDRLFSVLGHDLRAPMGRVIGLLAVLSFHNRSKEEREIIDKLKQQSVSTLETLDNLLMWGKSQITGQRLNQQDIFAKEHIQKAIFLYGDYTDRKNVKIIDQTRDDLLVHADPSHFDFVIRNLLSNAIKFSHSGGVIELSAFIADNHREVIFAVKDLGIGIHQNLQAQIFAFNTESLRGTWDEKGTGIGLMLCQEYITENGGRMWVESAEGKGSTFYFSLLKEKSTHQSRQLA